jgi:hypothetical protein
MKLNRQSVYRSVGIMAVLGLGVMLAPQKAKAFFGEDILLLIQQLAQLKMIYEQQRQQVMMAKQSLERFTRKDSWITVGKRAADVYSVNTVGETIPWDVMTRGNPLVAQNAWTTATVAVKPNPLLRNELVGGSATLAHLASVETIDRASVQCLATIAQYRVDTAQNRSAYTSLENAQLDSSEGTNSEIQQLNLINAANAQAANERRSQGNIQACLAEQQTLANKIQRDSIVQNLNTLTEMQRGLANSPAPGNMAEAIKNY